MRTRIDGRWVVGYDEAAESHVVHEGGTLLLEDDDVSYVGTDGDRTADRHLQGEYLILPGMVNLHAHLDTAIAPYFHDRRRGTEWTRPKSWVDDPDERPVFGPADVEAAARHSIAALLLTGTTTFADLTSFVCKRWDDPLYEPHVYADTAGEMGLRAYLSHRYRSGVPYYENGTRQVEWDRERGERGFQRALRFVDEYHGTYDDRIRTMLFPYTLDSVSPDLLERTKEQADDRNLVVRLHAAQSKTEVETLEERHGATPVEFLADRGLLDENVCLTHCMYPDGQWRADGRPDPADETLEQIGTAGTSVVYCPVVYRRSGAVLNSVSRYRSQGINIALGTDTFPQNVLEEMRWGALGTKLVEDDPAAGTAREMFDAVTVGGARALGRSDIGRLAPGAKADVVVVDVSGLHVNPIHDPLTALVHYATPDDIAHVFVDGQHLVRDGAIPGMDEQRVLARAQRVHEKLGRTFTEWTAQNRDKRSGELDADEVFPSTYPVDPDFDRGR